ncbi:MAG: hypothetical protein ACK5Q5_24110 [Planctomycetaceae bacterium]
MRDSGPTAVFILGTGQCGLPAIVDVLNRQPGCEFTCEKPPLLPWQPVDRRPRMSQRIERMRREANTPNYGDAASSYLPYVEEILRLVPNCRFVCLERPKREVVANFESWLDRNFPIPMNHWSPRPGPMANHDPYWTRIYPKYDLSDRSKCIEQYWEQYTDMSRRWATRLPDQFRIFDPAIALDTNEGLRDLLSFIGVRAAEQQILPGRWAARPEPDHVRERPMARRAGPNPMDPKRCAILVPYNTQIVPQCEESLKELERRGYVVRRVAGFAAIDQGRNQLATDALLDGFEETLWIDSDVSFHADAVERIRSHGLPICCAIYPQKGKRALATHVLPGTPTMTFGKNGGLHEILYAATGFLHVRRSLYMHMIEAMQLPICNERFNHPTIPFFQPMLHDIDDGTWYLAEDYAFSERVRRLGYKIPADTTIRLYHYGFYGYGWEDAGRSPERFQSFTLTFGKPSVDGPAWDTGPRPAPDGVAADE